MAAKKKPVQTLSLADLGVAADEVGFAGATSAVRRAQQAPAALRPAPRSPTRATAACKLVEFLAVREVRLRGVDDMAEVLVVVEASGGAASRRSRWRC